MFSYSYEEVIGMFATDIFTDESKEIVKKNILSGKIEPYDAIAVRKDGSEFYVEIQGLNFQYQGKNLRITAIRDISNRKRIEQEIIIAKDKAEESDRLKTEFINNMSHEIRTPMNGILGFSELLSNSNISELKQKQYITIIQSNSRQLMRIIDDILEISRLGTKQVKTFKNKVCINKLLQRQYEVFNIKAKEVPLYLKNKLSDAESTIYTDETKLNKVISNLLENALKFTDTGFVEFGYEVKEKKQSKYIEIYVKDTGIGIKQEKQEMIFHRFSQEEKYFSKNKGGLGLGLSIAKENTELIGGEISVKSEKGKGATFFIKIPYEKIAIKPKFILDDNIDATKNKKSDKYTFLIVEDEEVNFLYLDTLLNNIYKNSIRLHAKNGEEAVEICKNNNNIDFVFMDLKMPVMNGFEATKK